MECVTLVYVPFPVLWLDPGVLPDRGMGAAGKDSCKAGDVDSARVDVSAMVVILSK